MAKTELLEIPPRLEQAMVELNEALNKLKLAQDPIVKSVLREIAREKLNQAADIDDAWTKQVDIIRIQHLFDN